MAAAESSVERRLIFLHEAKIASPPDISILDEPSDSDFTPSQSDLAEARSILVEQRTSEPGFRQPEQKKRYFFKDEKWKKDKGTVDTWVFTKHEVARAFNELLERVPLPSPCIAQALLSHIPRASTEEIWRHLHDKTLEKRNIKSFFAPKPPSEPIPEVPWLDWSILHDHSDYLRLLSQAGIAQSNLDRAFGVALSKNSIEAMSILLRAGSVASSFQGAIREQVRIDNLELITLLLSVPRAMSVEAWHSCLDPELQKENPTILLQCLAHRPDVARGPLLLNSLTAQNFAATAVILAYANSGRNFYDVRESACRTVSQVQDDKRRLQLFNLLSMSGLLTDILVLREELMKGVKSRCTKLVQILVEARVSVDMEPNNAIRVAVTRMDLEILELFKHGVFSSPVSLMLKHVPENTSESDMLRLINIFRFRELSGELLDAQLIRAAQKQQLRLVESLVSCGASMGSHQAPIIQAALREANFNLLDMLLQYECTPEKLSMTIPFAMDLKPRSVRLAAMRRLTLKGVLAQELATPLQMLVAEDGDVDLELIRLILQYHAPLDNDEDESKNAVFVAIQRGLDSLLQLLCDAAPQRNTLSTALSMAVETINTHGYDTAFSMVKTLVQRGATGELANQTLLAAARQDKLEIVQLLVENGAETNRESGASFAVAIENANIQLLEILCNACPPMPASIESVLPIATSPSFFNSRILDLLLRSTPSVRIILNSFWSSDKFKGNPNIAQIISCFLRHGMDVNLGGGALPCFAIQERNFELLVNILSAAPSLDSLKAAFREASNVQERPIRLEVMKVLLERARSAEIGQSKVLLQETRYAMKHDSQGLELLLCYKADVNSDMGMAVHEAATAGSLKTLAVLLASRPALRTIQYACLATASSPRISPDQKQTVLERLLDANGGVTVDGMSMILTVSIATLPTCTELPKLLLMRGANIDLETLKTAVDVCSEPVVKGLINSISGFDTVSKLFRYAREKKMDSGRKRWIYTCLLHKDIPSTEVSEALLDALTCESSGDVSLCELLLENRARVEYKDEAAFTLAFDLGSLDVVVLLSRYLSNSHTARRVFELVREHHSLDNSMRLGSYRCLLRWRIKKSSINRALAENLASKLPDTAIMKLLVKHGANPYKDKARCFIVTSKKGEVDAFRAISRHKKSYPELVLRSLLTNFDEEWQVVYWFKIYLAEHSYSVRITQDRLLFQCMRKFPQGTELLKLLLNNGLSSSAKVTSRLCPSWEPELCTALVWALSSSKPEIGNGAILTLLSRGGLPAYSTPLSKVSGAFLCVLDSKRTEVLQALIRLDRTRVMEHTMPASKFCHLAAYPKVTEPDPGVPEDTSELRLYVASVYTGNFDAFLLMRVENVPNDGMLHLAAMLALPKFVQWLLDSHHEANHQMEETGPMIPLAMVCSSKFQTWCRMANKESDLLSRQKQTMILLASKSRSEWKYRGKTVLHVAFDEGHEVTQAMIEALNISEDTEKDEKYLYMDRTGIHYSPDQYVTRMLTIDQKSKDALLNVLTECRLKPRYYRDVKPAEGEQPPGFQGLPPTLSLLWSEST